MRCDGTRPAAGLSRPQSPSFPPDCRPKDNHNASQQPQSVSVMLVNSITDTVSAASCCILIGTPDQRAPAVCSPEHAHGCPSITNRVRVRIGGCILAQARVWARAKVSAWSGLEVSKFLDANPLSTSSHFRTPGGRPDCRASSASISDAPGSFSDGFSTKVLPAAMATGHIHSGTIAGKLNGHMPATTWHQDSDNASPIVCACDAVHYRSCAR